MNIISAILGSSTTAIVHVCLVVIVLLMVIYKSRWSKTALRIWTAIIMLGALLRLLSITLFLLAGQPERIEYERVILSSIHLIIAIVLFSYVDKLDVKFSNQEETPTSH